MSTIALIFGAAGAVKSISAYLGLVENAHSNVKKILYQSFLSAKHNLEYAKNAFGETQNKYLEQAKSEFIRATAVENDENLTSSYLGLAICQYLLKDNINAKNTICKINSVKLTNSEKIKGGLTGLFNPMLVAAPALHPILHIALDFQEI